MHIYELVGPNAGKTINLGGFQFVDGGYDHSVVADQTGVEHLTVYLARCYNAHPQGSEELASAKAEYEQAKKAPKPETVQEPAPASEEQPAAPPAPPAPPADQTVADADVKQAVESLDHEDDTHWTDAGLPKVEAVEDLAGKQVTRALIEASAPGFTRAAAKAAAAI